MKGGFLGELFWFVFKYLEITAKNVVSVLSVQEGITSHVLLYQLFAAESQVKYKSILLPSCL